MAAPPSSDARLDTAVEAFANASRAPALIKAACHEFAHLLDADACTISRLVGELIVELCEFSRSGKTLVPLGYGYVLADYPLTQQVVDSREPRTVVVADPAADQAEVALLQELGFEVLLMVPLVVRDTVWALIEVYDVGRQFSDADAELAVGLAGHAGTRLEELFGY